MATSQDFVNWVCSDRLDYRFLKYILLAENSAFLRFASGTTHQTIYFPEVKAFHVCLPPLREQQAIADILGTLDDKIELNRRMSETLEEMARALFKSWFVDFEPVRAKAKGRDPGLPPHLSDLFPDTLISSELGEIPTGWDHGTLSALAKLNPENWPKNSLPDTVHYIDLSSVTWGRLSTATAYASEDAPSRARRRLRPLDTIIGVVRPGNGNYALILEEGLTGSTGFAVLRPLKRSWAEFIYLASTALPSIDALSHLADGAAYPAIRPSDVANTQVAKAPDSVLKSFSRLTGPLLRRIAICHRESASLELVRSALLPKLIRGEIRVPPLSVGGTGSAV